MKCPKCVSIQIIGHNSYVPNMQPCLEFSMPATGLVISIETHLWYMSVVYRQCRCNTLPPTSGAILITAISPITAGENIIVIQIVAESTGSVSAQETAP